MYVLVSIGFVLLFGGGELLVRGAVAVSRRLSISPLLVGMTVVAWCTSAPELVVSLGAALAGQSDIAMGNIVGSNIFNVLGVVGAAALLAPIVVKPRALRRDVAVMLASSAALVVVAQLGSMGRFVGLIFAASLAFYIWYSYRFESRSPGSPEAEVHQHEAAEFSAVRPLWVGITYFAVGLIALVIGSRLLIVGATEIAMTLGVSEVAIGLTLVAVGTSLPELATSVVAALRRHSDVAVGNVVGSNIFNILGILGVTSVVRPIGVAERIATVDVWVMMAVAAWIAVLLLWRGRVGRIAAVLSLVAYVAYAVLLLA